MKYTLILDSRRPDIALVCDEDGQPIEYESGSYRTKWAHSYQPTKRESELRREIERQFPQLTINGITPKPYVGRFEAQGQSILELR